jgi:glucosamine--fructose-6-phosphate aminotransferase (isomerizing)
VHTSRLVPRQLQHHQGTQHEDPGMRASFADEIIVPAAPALVTPLLHLTAGQMLAYYTALALGRNIDKPRALAKSVTVV